MISYLHACGSRLSIRPSAVSAWGYIRNGSGSPCDSGSATSCAKLYAIQFISHEPNSRARAAVTIASSSGRFPGGSSSTTLRTSAGSTGTQPYPSRYTSARQCCDFVTWSDDAPRARRGFAERVVHDPVVDRTGFVHVARRAARDRVGLLLDN